MIDNDNEINEPDSEINTNYNGRETVRIIFGKKIEEEITDKIKTIKDSSMEILQKHTKELEKRLEKFQTQIDEYITENSTRITKCFNL